MNTFSAVLLVCIGFCAPAQAQQQTLFGATNPGTTTFQDSPVNLGVKFQSSVSGQVVGVRFYKGSGNTGTHTGSLWTAGGVNLATVTFTGETASGWQQQNFASPVAIQANTTYVVSYFAPNAFYSAADPYFTSAHVSGNLTAPASSTSGGNGVYTYGSATAFPRSNYLQSNYWVDLVFVPSASSAPLVLDIPISIPCGVAPGSVVQTLGTLGGDGNAVTWSIAGDTTDFVLSGSSVVVGPNGVSTASCGQTKTVTATATQP
jgi:hypothetical protein